MRTPALALLAAAVPLFTLSAHAAVTRTFVSGSGNDANTATNCGVTTPCRSFNAALSVTSADGQVVALDTAGYGPAPVTITQGVSIIAAPGALAAISVSSGNGFVVNGSGINVAIEGVAIIGFNGATGIVFEQGSHLYLRRVEVSTNGTGVAHNAPSGVLTMSDSVLRAGNPCFIAQTTSPTAPVYASIDNSRAEGCYFGFEAQANSFVSIQHSSASGTAGSGANNCYADFLGLGDATGTGTLFLDDVHATNCYYGVASGPLATGGGASVTVSNSFVTNNSVGLGVFGGSTGQTYGNNHVYGNTSNTNGAYSLITPQ